jgi:hypothetical protein
MQHNKPLSIKDKSYSDLYLNIRDDWDPILAKAGHDIVLHVQKSPLSYLEQIQFASFRRIIEINISDFQLKNLLNYFCGQRAPLLKYHFAIIEDDYITTITQEDLAEADKTGLFYHPKTGEKVDNYEEKIYVMYDLNDKFTELKKKS